MHEEGHYIIPGVAEGWRSLFLTTVMSGFPNGFTELAAPTLVLDVVLGFGPCATGIIPSTRRAKVLEESIGVD